MQTIWKTGGQNLKLRKQAMRGHLTIAYNRPKSHPANTFTSITRFMHQGVLGHAIKLLIDMALSGPT